MINVFGKLYYFYVALHSFLSQILNSKLIFDGIRAQ